MRSIRNLLILAIGLSVLCTGCRAPREVQPLSNFQMQSFFSNAQDPRRFWITVYRSERGPTFEGVNRIHPEQFSVLVFKSRGNSSAPVVDMDAGGSKKFAALIDTTAARSWVSMDNARQFNLVPLGPPAYRYRPKHVADDIPGFICVASKLRFDQLNMETALICVRAAFGPLDPLDRGVEKPEIDFILGADILKGFSFVQVDYPNRRVIISSTEPYSPHNLSLVAAVPFQKASGAIAVKGQINKQPALILIDTAGDFGLITGDPAIQNFRQLRIGNLEISDPIVELSSDHKVGIAKYPRIGRKILENYRVTFDMKRRMLYLERPMRAKREQAVDVNPLGSEADRAPLRR